MESQINKSKLFIESKENNEKKKKTLVKKDMSKTPKETPEENDVIIISKNFRKCIFFLIFEI